MIEVFTITLSKDQLRAIPTDERNLLLLASHGVNQLSVLRKILLFSLNYESGSDLENTLSAAQSQTILRLLLGAMAEAWEMVKRPVNQKLIGTNYGKSIGPDGDAAYAKLNKHFGASNLLHTIRNKLAYHYPDAQQLEAAFEHVPEDWDMSWYPSVTINNSFYLASDLVISAGMLLATGEKDVESAYRKILGIVRAVSEDMIEFFLCLMRAVVRERLGEDILKLHGGTKIPFAPKIDDVAIPFFTMRDDDGTRLDGRAV